MIVTYLIFPQLRQFSFQIVFCLAIADLANSTANILSVTRFNGDPAPDGLCYVQALIKTYSNLSSILWVNLISWTMYRTVVLGRPNSMELLKRYLLIGFGIPILFIIP